MLDWGNQSSIVVFLDNNNYPSGPDGYECLMAVGNLEATGGINHNFISSENISQPDLLGALQRLHKDNKDWIFGHICYDFKNEIEKELTSRRTAKIGFPLLHFFIPETVCYIRKNSNSLDIESFTDPEIVYEEISGIMSRFESGNLPKLSFQSDVDKSTYINTIDQLRGHIAAGDCYEINYCVEGYCHGTQLSALPVFNALNKLSPAPFAAYYKLFDRYAMCASPERYLRKSGQKLTAQPIKGTAARDLDEDKDRQKIESLKSDLKERAENVMIVDLMRNDLARCCETGTINVDELFGIYTFPQVHQMISTVSGTMRSDVPFTDALRYSFPMGSMTGAPKYKVMQLIDNYEHARRELYSGTIGYIAPNGDFDFNVVIRSLFYNAQNQYLCYHTGGAITWDSKPEEEWQEMRLKAWALERIFQ